MTTRNFLIVAVTATCLTGCGSQVREVSGRVLLDGEPMGSVCVGFHPPGTTDVDLMIPPTNDDGTFHHVVHPKAPATASGTFHVYFFDPRFRIPKNYTDPESQIVVQLQDGATDLGDIELTRHGMPPTRPHTLEEELAESYRSKR